MEPPTTPSHPNRAFKFGWRWTEGVSGVTNEVSREQAFEQHCRGEGYTVLIYENARLKYVAVVGPELRHITLLDESGKSEVTFQFDEIKKGELFLTRVNPRPKGVVDKQSGRVLGERFNFALAPDGKVTIYKMVVPSGRVEDIENWVAYGRCDPAGLWESLPPFGEFDALLKRDRVNLDALTAQIRAEDWTRLAPPKSAKAYDKASYHEEAVAKLKLPPEHAENQTLFFLRWLIENNLMRGWYMKAAADTLEECRTGKATIRDVYHQMASAIMSDMLTPEGEEFVKYYYYVAKVRAVGYPRDYATVLQGNLPSSYHVQYTEENYQRIKPVLDRRFQDWKQAASQK